MKYDFTDSSCILSFQEIPLSEILEVCPASDFNLVPSGASPHCFEIVTGTIRYFVGEDSNPSQLPSMTVPTSSNSVGPISGVGQEVARAWENAIRQALMPVIFQDNPPSEGSTPHSKDTISESISFLCG